MAKTKAEIQDRAIDLKNDGTIILYKRRGLKKPNWIARLKVTGAKGYKVFSTKTTNQRQAERIALDKYEEAYFRVKNGGELNGRLFKTIFEEWKQNLHLLPANRLGGGWDEAAKRVEDYALRYFGDKVITELDNKTFEEYWIWRKANWRQRPPSDNTLRREKSCILPVLNYAFSKGYISRKPEISAPKEQKTRRPTFTINEWRKLTRQMREWLKDAERSAGFRSRFYAHNYFLILANTGLRVGEARNLTWSVLRTVDTDDGNRLVGEVSGKTGLREFVFQSGAEDYVKRIFDYRTEERGETPPINECIFCHKDGTRVNSFKKSFGNLLDFAGISKTKRGQQLSIYSLRHFYATQRLTNEANPFLLAKQMGTSVEMLEKYYGQIMSSNVATQITKSTTKPRQNTYPFD